MKCIKCGYFNKHGSKFCNECGQKLDLHDEKIDLAAELSDIIFVPKKDDYRILKIFIVIWVICIIILAAYGIYKYQYTLSAISNKVFGSSLTCIQLKDEEMHGDNYTFYSETDPTFIANIQNNCDKPYSNIKVRFNFFNNGSDFPTDTVYIQVADHLDVNETRIVNMVVPTNADTSGDFRWTVEVESAE